MRAICCLFLLLFVWWTANILQLFRELWAFQILAKQRIHVLWALQRIEKVRKAWPLTENHNADVSTEFLVHSLYVTWDHSEL